MASLTIKNVPDHLLKRLRATAAEQRRSLNQQVIVLLESALTDTGDDARRRLEEHTKAQAAAWERLAGRWSDAEDDLAAHIYESRSGGRPVGL